MFIVIEIKEKTITLTIMDKNDVIDALTFPEAHDLSEKLLPAVDNLLIKNKFSAQDIERMEVLADVGENFTTFRIAKSVAEAFNFAKTGKTSDEVA
jgi:tRNA A37 threonylcarbamoyladenosine modification protein TsaB